MVAKLWDAKLTWYYQSITCYIRLIDLEHSLRIHGLRGLQNICLTQVFYLIYYIH